jgi:hypothetical protein
MLQPIVIDTFPSHFFGSLNQLPTAMNSYELFFYVSSKLANSPGAIIYRIEQKQCIVLYYDNLSSKNSVRIDQVMQVFVRPWKG